MRRHQLYKDLLVSRENGTRQFAVLIDPDKLDEDGLTRVIQAGDKGKCDFILCGGSLLTADRLDWCISHVRTLTNTPVILFPGSHLQLSSAADAILLLSLISGRNPELLIGEHVKAVHKISASDLEVIPTGYLMVESGAITSAQYMSNTLPIPRDKPDIAATTALAGQMLGLRNIYLEAGSGARFPVSADIIRAVRKAVELPIWVGGGIRTPEAARSAAEAGADVVVVGTAGEESPERITEIGLSLKEVHAG